jgi:hypothetical protein
MGVACSSKHSGESWGDAVPAASALFGLDYLQYRYIGAPNALVAPIYEMIHYGRASTK